MPCYFISTWFLRTGDNAAEPSYTLVSTAGRAPREHLGDGKVRPRDSEQLATRLGTHSDRAGAKIQAPNLHPKATSPLPPTHHTFHLSSSEASSIIRSDSNQLGTGVWFNHSSTIFHEFIHTPQSPSGDSQTISAERQTQLFGSRVTLGARP